MGIRVDFETRQGVVEKITNWIEGGKQCRQVVTAYSEFFVAAEKDPKFSEVLVKADLVVPDGISVLAARQYQVSSIKYKGFRKFWCGLETGLKVIRGELGETVTGVWLFSELVGLAKKNNWKIFLLGGFGDVAERLARELRVKSQELRIESDAGIPDNEEIETIQKINKFEPDILFVAYGPVKQEKWISENKHRLKAKVAIGVGGTFDEYLGEFQQAPRFMEEHGLKWLWRLIQQPNRIIRIWNAVVVFPWKVYKWKKIQY